MKRLKTILPITAFTAALIGFWLIPNINKAKTVRYTRTIEDTERLSEEINPKEKVTRTEKTKLTSQKIEEVKPKKKYIKESIDPNYSFQQVKMKMYSRAIHFEPENLELDSTETDSTVRLP